MTYVKVNDILYPAMITGKMSDENWDGRPSKTINLEMSHEDAISIFVDGVEWHILQESIFSQPQFDEDGNIIVDEEGTPIMAEQVVTEEFDNSEYNLAGDIIDHRDGTISVKMGKLTELEEVLEIMLGGANE